MSDPYNRTPEFGLLGTAMANALSSTGAPATLAPLGFTHKLLRFQSMVPELKAVGILAAAGASLLLMDYPLQFEVTEGEVIRLVNASVDKGALKATAHPDVGAYPSRRGYFRHLASAVMNNKTFRDSAFPKKKFAAAGIKANLSLPDLLRATCRVLGSEYVGELLSYFPRGTTRDILECAVLHSISVREYIGTAAPAVTAALLLQVDNAKGLSNALKALGANATFPGALFTETQAMQGRGVGAVDKRGEICRRTDKAAVDAQVLPLDDELAAAIDHVLNEELAECTLPDLDDWWSSRWLWCVNGSQNSASDEGLGLKRVPRDGLGGQRYRRMASEEVSTNPLLDWDGTTSVSYSDKLECGKTRAIFACDTASYFAFSYLLGAVQDAWRNDHVLLDPGRGGSTATARRIRNAMLRSGVNVMLDYDDFNSHHATETMQYLFDAVCRRVGAPDWYRDVICRSFDRMYIRDRRTQIRVLGTLMSGHRGTTFVNSVLNRAYILRAAGLRGLDHAVSVHTGDDVYLRLPTLADAAHLLEKCRAYGCRMNPSKQSIGFSRAEFVRMGINKHYAVGYLSRSIASTVAGNWVGGPIDPADALQNMVAATRTLINRGLPKFGADILCRSFYCTRSLPRKAIAAIFRGEAALGLGPTYNAGHRIRRYELRRSAPERTEPGRDWGRNATGSYLEKHVQPLEADAIRMAGVDLSGLMLESSYKKGRPSTPIDRSNPVRLIQLPPVPLLGCTDVPTVSKTTRERGCLTHLPLIQLFKDRLSDDNLRDLCISAGTVPSGSMHVREVAFGTEGRSLNIIGELPYSDACQFSKVAGSDNLIVSYPIRM